MKILGIDPGLHRCGFALVTGTTPGHLVDCGLITTPSGDELPMRLHDLHTDLTQIIRELQPDAAYIEELFFVKNITNGIAVAGARGVILLALAQAGVPVHDAKPMHIKQAVAGGGHAKKDQVQRAICLHYGLDTAPQPDDVADAVAVAYYGATRG